MQRGDINLARAQATTAASTRSCGVLLVWCCKQTHPPAATCLLSPVSCSQKAGSYTNQGVVNSLGRNGSWGIGVMAFRRLPCNQITYARTSSKVACIKQKRPKRGVFTEFLAEWTGLEPATPGVTGRYSNQLNYHSKPKLWRPHGD